MAPRSGSRRPAPAPAHEGPLLEVFRRHGVEDVLLPLAVHPERPWLLFDDGGPTLRATRPDGTGDHDLAAWERILAEYAALQRSVEGEATRDEMLAAGVPDGRPSRLPGELARLLEDDVAWSRITDDERAAADAARARLRGSLAAVEPTPSRSWRRPGSPPRSSTTTCTAATSWSARAATGSSTGATPSSPTRSRR